MAGFYLSLADYLERRKFAPVSVSTTPFIQTPPAHSSSHHSGFSLLELLLVVSLILTILGLASLGSQGLNRDRRAAITELRAVLESARSTARARRTDVYVAFATDQTVDPEHRFRRYAMFLPDPNPTFAKAESGQIFLRSIVPLSEWHGLPDGLLFACGAEFGPGLNFATVMDVPADFCRQFRCDGADVTMPFLLFNAQGMLEIPPLYGERFHHVGIVEADYEPGQTAETGVANRVYLGWRTLSGRRLPRAGCLSIDPFSGRSTILEN